jgi:hypothetical protein
MEGSLVAYKVFTNGSVLNASEINDNLMNQSVMVFSNSTARSAALTSPLEGMLTWLEDVNRYESYNGTAWVALGSGKILQVVQTIKTDTFTVASGASFVAITGLSATITPSAATSKILVIANVQYGIPDSANFGTFRLYGGNTSTYIGDAAGSRIRGLFGGGFGAAGAAILLSASMTYLDSPATTSATTYGVEVDPDASTFVNRSVEDGDSIHRTRGASSIILMEVAA